jgi:V8-like Glu-specific endopeptidase
MRQTLQYLSVFYFLSIASAQALTNPRVIYGEDSRRDYFEVAKESSWLSIGDSSVALVDPRSIRRTDAGVLQIFGGTFSQSENLCPGEKFESQPVVAFCSGVLIAPDLVLTAGHCLGNLAMCRLTHFVFNAAVLSADKATASGPIDLADSDVYNCEDIVHTQEGHSSEDVADFAIARLDRPVKAHIPANFESDQSTLTKGMSLRAVGYPSGLPMKFVEGKVRSNDLSKSFFVTNLDTFHRNSGSPVFDAETGRLQGVVVDGEDDFEKTGSCNRVRHCSEDGCRGESVTRMAAILPYLK